MKIGMISQWYEPETGAAAHPTAIARALQERGHELKVLTGFPSYPQGAVHPGYSMSLRQHEVRDGIELRRVPDLPSHDQSAVRRALTLTSFAASATVQVGWLRDCDVVLTYLSPATVGLASWTLERVSRVPYVLYVQDLWPETVTASGFIGNERVTAAVEGLVHRGLKGLYRRAAGVAAISPTMARTLADRGPSTEPVSVPNWIDERVFAPAEPGWTPQLPTDRSWIMYAGGIGDVQALDHAVRALALVPDLDDLGLAFVGDGVARSGLEALAAELGLEDRVRFLGSRPMEQMPALMAESMAQLVSLKDLPLFSGTIPSKIQASMACGAPVVCAVAGDAAQIIREAEAGLVVPPESAEALAGAFRELVALGREGRERLGRNGRRAYETQLSAAAGAARLEQMLVEATRAAR